MKGRRLITTAIGAGCIMSLGLIASVTASRSTTMCSELELAGMSYTLDKYCSIQSGVGSDPEAIVAFADMLNGGAASGGASAVDALFQEQSVENDEIKSASEYENVGISIAADYVNIRKEPNTDAEIVGKLYRGSAATIVSDADEWVFIKSGSVEGYIRKDYLAIGYSAEKLIDEFGTKWATVQTETLRVRESSDSNSTVLTLVSQDESYPVVNEYDDWAKINVDDDCVGYVSKDYVKITVQFKKAVSIEEEREEQRRREAAEAAEADDSNTGNNGGNTGNTGNTNTGNTGNNGGGSNTGGNDNSGGGSGSGSGNGGGGSNSGSGNGGGGSDNGGGSGNGGGGEAGGDAGGGGGSESDGDGDSGSAIADGDGSAVASYALQFVGNPYVYGGTSLTNGTDCSGFTMSVYAHFGISLPRTSSSQSTVGKRISWEDAEAGDLIFYGSGGHVSHVALCIGGGRVVHASSSRTGIKTSPINYRTPIVARRILR